MSVAAAGPLSGITKVFKGIGSAISTSLGPLGMLLNIFEQLGIIQPLLDVLSVFVGILGTAFMPLLTMLMNIITPMIPSFQMLVTAITPLITLIGSILVPFGVFNTLLPVVTYLLTLLTDGLNYITPYLQIFQNLINSINLENIINVVQNFGPQIIEGIRTGFQGAIDWFHYDLPNYIKNAIASGWNNMVEGIREWFT